MGLPCADDPSLLVSTLLWRGKEISRESLRALPTGYAELDRVLPGQGWPLGALTEIIVPHWGIGELRLLLPAMAAMTRERRWLAWVAPPHTPYAPALLMGGVDLEFTLLIDVGNCDKDLLWSMEKLLRSPLTGMTLGWPKGNLSTGALRRLQLAAESAGTLGFLLSREGIQGSPAALRVKVHPVEQGLAVEVLKSRGSWLRQGVVLSL